MAASNLARRVEKLSMPFNSRSPRWNAPNRPEAEQPEMHARAATERVGLLVRALRRRRMVHGKLGPRSR